mmetsp:Transcript_22784/g.27867  ORF Transcript_22784/g.27867 Transcript_22784/m.27867 type:complete len:95 (-) Transcript_22784:21-305(-)
MISHAIFVTGSRVTQVWIVANGGSVRITISSPTQICQTISTGSDVVGLATSAVIIPAPLTGWSYQSEIGGYDDGEQECMLRHRLLKLSLAYKFF